MGILVVGPAFLDDNLIDRPSVEEDIALEADRIAEVAMAIHTKAVEVDRTEAEVIHIRAALPLADHIEVAFVAIRTKVVMADRTAEEVARIVVVTCHPLVAAVRKAVEAIRIEEVADPWVVVRIVVGEVDRTVVIPSVVAALADPWEDIHLDPLAVSPSWPTVHIEASHFVQTEQEPHSIPS